MWRDYTRIGGTEDRGYVEGLYTDRRNRRQRICGGTIHGEEEQKTEDMWRDYTRLGGTEDKGYVEGLYTERRNRRQRICGGAIHG